MILLGTDRIQSIGVNDGHAVGWRRAIAARGAATAGDSLGAHTSQAPFQGWGTARPEALGVDRALWSGTPGELREELREAILP
jgi:hypothetical protein